MTEALIDRFVRHVLDTPFEAFSESDLLAAKKRLIDSMGCALSGSTSPAMTRCSIWSVAGRALPRPPFSGGRIGCRCRTRR